MANIDFPTSPVSGTTYSFNNSIWVYNGKAWVNALSTTIANAKLGQFGVVIDNTPNTITTGMKASITMPYSGTITSWIIIGDQTGSIAVDIYKTNYAGYPGSVANSISPSNKINLSSQSKNISTTLSGWTTTFSAGDIMQFNVDSISTLNKVTITVLTSKA